MKLSNILILLTLVAVCLCARRPNGISLKDNGYSNFLIAISEDVAENWDIVTKLQEYFTKASKFLYRATKNRAYFKEINILIPVSWANNEKYTSASNEYVNNADVIVTKQGLELEDPYVKTYSGCGEAAEYLQISDGFLTHLENEDFYGPIEKLIVHEWGHLRWGVFDEYPLTGGQEFYYSMYSESYEPTRCTRGLKGRIYRYDKPTRKYVDCTDEDVSSGKGCTFNPYYTKNKQRSSVVASIMDRQYVETINTFCDSSDDYLGKQHNNEAPTQQNAMCKGRSTWDVIAGTADFKDGVNPPRIISDIDLIPTFTFIRHRQVFNRVVLLLDDSGSMNRDHKRDRLKHVVGRFLRSGIKDGTEVGMIRFESLSRVMSPLRKLNNQSDREEIIAKLPKICGGETSIGSGLLAALKLFNNTDGSAKGGTIILVSDGKENVAPSISDVMENVTDSQVTIHSIAFTDKADLNMSSLAKNTGGDFYFDRNKPQSTQIHTAFTAITNKLNNALLRDAAVNEILLVSDLMKPKASISKEALLTGGLGVSTTFTLMYTYFKPEFRVTSPSDVVYTHESSGVRYDKPVKMLELEFPDIAETGTWTLTMTNPDDYEQILSMTFTSKPTNKNEEILLKAYTSNPENTWPPQWVIMADASKGGKPVIGLTVIATVDRPVGDDVDVQLFDNGVGADLIKNDGVYSRYFTAFNSRGRYSVSLTVNSKPGITEVLRVNTGLKGRRRIDVDDLKPPAGTTTPKEKETPDVSVVASGGAIDVSVPDDRIKDFESGDLYPPSAITDLKVAATDPDKPSVTLVWTATGDERDNGKATRYEIMYAKNSASLSTSSPISQDDVIVGDLDNPKMSNKRERFVIRVRYDKTVNVSYVFAVKAIDDVNKTSEMSNIYSAGFGTVPAVIERDRPDSGDTEPEDETFNEDETRSGIAANEEEEESWFSQHKTVVIGAAVGSVAVVGMVTAGSLIYIKYFRFPKVAPLSKLP